MELSERTSKENSFERFLKKYVQLNEVKNNKLELAIFLKRCLMFFKFWIPGEISYWRWALGHFIFFLSNGVLFMAAAHLIRHAIISDEFQLGEVISDFPLILAIPSSYIVFRAFYASQKQWAALLMEVGNFEKYDKPDGIELSDAIAAVRLKCMLCIIYIPIPFLTHYFFTVECDDPEDTMCGFMFPFYFPGCMKGLRPVCAFIHMWFAYALATFGYINGAFLTQTSQYLVVYLLYFQGMLKKISLIDNWDERWIHVQKTLKYHQRILQLYEWYYKLVKDVYLVHVFGTPIILAVLMYTFMTDFRIQNVAYFMLWIFSLGTVCFFGQRMVNESETVLLVAYQSIPFDGDNRTAKALLFLIHRAQKIMHIPAGSLAFCGNDLFVAVGKTMYSYLAVIKNTSTIEGK